MKSRVSNDEMTIPLAIEVGRSTFVRIGVFDLTLRGPSARWLMSTGKGAI